MRFVTLVTTAAVAVLALPGAGTRHAERTVAHAATARPSKLVAIDWASTPSRPMLVKLDAVTLEPVPSPTVPVTRAGGWNLSPDGTQIAFGAERGALSVVDLRSMALVREIAIGGPWSDVRAWPETRRLFAVSSLQPATFVVVDPVAGRVVA